MALFSRLAFELWPQCILALLLSLFLILMVVAVYRITIHPLAKYPGPLWGKITDCYGAYHAWEGDSHLHLYDLHERYGEIVRYGPNRVSINTDTALRSIYSFTANVRKADDYKVFPANPRNPSLHTAIEKLEHGRKRRVISHGFSDSSLRTLEPKILANIEVFCRQLLVSNESGETDESHKYTPGDWSPVRDMADWANYLSFDIMGALVFGQPFGMMEHTRTRWVMDLIPTAIHHKYISGFVPWAYYSGLIDLVFRKLTSQRENLRSFTNGLVKSRVALKGQKDNKDIFQLVLDAKDPETGQGFSIEELGSEASVMINAGSDTSSTAIAATFFYLVNHPEALAAAVSEVRSSFSSVSDIKSGNRLSSCTYLRACIDETMRLSPPIPALMPRQVGPGGFTVDGNHFPEGTVLGTPAYVVMRNPKYYKDPEVFDPSRWIAGEQNSPENIESARRAFCPFSIGPRGCIGRGLAYVELTIVLAQVLWLYDLRLAPGEKEDPTASYPLFDCFITKKRGPMVQFKTRKI